MLLGSDQLKEQLEYLSTHNIKKCTMSTNIGSGFFMDASVADATRPFVEVGFGFHVELTHPEALAFIPKKQDLLRMSALDVLAMRSSPRPSRRLANVERKLADLDERISKVRPKRIPKNVNATSSPVFLIAHRAPVVAVSCRWRPASSTCTSSTMPSSREPPMKRHDRHRRNTWVPFRCLA